jgi:RimJ/RimL family protein N-acetyltransferase
VRPDVTLRPLDEPRLLALLAAASADADPYEVMPPADPDGPPGWTAARRDAFLAFHRGRALAPEPVEVTYAIHVGEDVVGAARLCPLDEPEGAVEAGVWVGRSHRGAGVGGAVLQRLISLARTAGFATFFVGTRADNTPVLRLLAGLGAVTVREEGRVTTLIDLGLSEPETEHATDSRTGAGAAPAARQPFNG